MNKLVGLWGSTLGKKVLMAGTGIILFGFVVGHMVGNLQIYIPDGGEQLNHYGEFLQSKTGVLWVVRSVLLFCVGVHILAAVQLWLRNRAARPVAYRVFRPPAVDYAARTMKWSGPIIAAFIVYHLLHFTIGTVHPDFRPGDVFRNVVIGFSNPWAAGFYILANFLLAVHLYHGIWSLFQTMGWEHPHLNPWRRVVAIGFAVVIGAGNISIPLAVLTGVVHL